VEGNAVILTVLDAADYALEHLTVGLPQKYGAYSLVSGLLFALVSLGEKTKGII